MEKQYIEIEFLAGQSLDKCVLELVRWASKGEFVCGDFNGHKLYSDTVSMDSAYKEVLNTTLFERLESERKWREDIKKQELEHKEAIPRLTKEWIEKGHKILAEDKWELWDKCVPVRLDDLYKGMELGNCLEIIDAINNKTLEDAVMVMKNQGHSGMSWGLVKSMVKSFSDRGEEFCSLLSV